MLGHITSEKGVRMSESRIAAVQAVPFPRSAHELRRFLGMCNYMWRHISNLAALGKPLSSRVNKPVSAWPREVMMTAFDATRWAVQGPFGLYPSNRLRKI